MNFDFFILRSFGIETYSDSLGLHCPALTNDTIISIYSWFNKQSDLTDE